VLLGLTVAFLISISKLLTEFSLEAVIDAAVILLVALVMWLLILGVLLAASKSGKTDPELLDPVSGGPEWDNLFASHDPVSNGPMAVSDKGDTTAACLRFYERQHEVTNRRSMLRDHTSYWDSPDDFVARIANRLLEISAGGQSRLFRAWIDVAAERRRWRVQIRSSFRWVTGIIGVMALLTSRVNVELVNATREIFGGLKVELLGLVTWTLPELSLPDWLFRILLMLGVLAVAFIVTDSGCKFWEWTERRQFFHQEGYRLAHMPMAAVGAGWLALIASIPIVSVLGDQHAALRFDPLWPTLAALVGSAFILRRLYKAPGTHERWALQLLQIGEEQLNAANTDRESLEEARNALKVSHTILDHIHHNESKRAARGLAAAQERLSNFPSAPISQGQ
jgi:hypothetical protein